MCQIRQNIIKKVVPLSTQNEAGVHVIMYEGVYDEDIHYKNKWSDEAEQKIQNMETDSET